MEPAPAPPTGEPSPEPVMDNVVPPVTESEPATATPPAPALEPASPGEGEDASSSALATETPVGAAFQ